MDGENLLNMFREVEVMEYKEIRDFFHFLKFPDANIQIPKQI